MEQAAEGRHAAEDVSFVQQDHQRAAWQRTHHRAVELPGAVASHAARGSHILRLHRRSEAVALRAERLQGHAADDRGHFQ